MLSSRCGCQGVLHEGSGPHVGLQGGRGPEIVARVSLCDGPRPLPWRSTYSPCCSRPDSRVVRPGWTAFSRILVPKENQGRTR
jgi:hypothetical protein